MVCYKSLFRIFCRDVSALLWLLSQLRCEGVQVTLHQQMDAQFPLIHMSRLERPERT